MFLIKFLFILLGSLLVVENCNQGQFQTDWLAGCVDCPGENPEKNCDREGEYSDSCKEQCTTSKGKRPISKLNIEFESPIYVIN